MVDMIHGCLLGAEPINPEPEWDYAKSGTKTATENDNKQETANTEPLSKTSAAAGKKSVMKSMNSQQINSSS